ncbi:MAG: bifunctional diaminohydroxyphosphoribosylaminopyrimidine deaminase/5-amino-6-(5-phosphoribosylamino)uracil reductase RibD [Bacteroidales bacterium]|nr:bifunctional diaminohydroxyphosphoribosylaminopyrimidine deaminase/5-amino-6-(5-phosphoribosylamino)uracil reductase RibD [Bacteroidales bacterium]
MQKQNHPYDHKIFMHRCLELARNGFGNVAPNPMVGAVIVREGKIIAEGYHRKYGQAHAEVNAIRCIANEEILKESILYVNLEPCAHSGKTPPCSDMIIQKRIPEVVIGTSDPNSLVAGKGIEKLKRAGVRVTTNVLPESCRELNRRFFTYHEYQRPYIILKWAQTQDGFIDIKRTPDTPIGINWITTNYGRTLVHKWRAEEQAIMVGANTVLLDDPQLTLRYWPGENPVRILLDDQLSVSRQAKIFDDSATTYCYSSSKSGDEGKTRYIIPAADISDLKEVFSDLHQREISSVIVEGGKKVLENCIKYDLWDEARVFTGRKLFHDGLKAPVIEKDPISVTNFFGDTLSLYRS